MKRKRSRTGAGASVGALAVRWVIAWFCVLAAGALSSCHRDPAADGVGSAASAVHVTSTEPGPAAGPVIAARVTEAGDIVCTKSDGGPWSSAGGGHVEFELRPAGGMWQYVGSHDYAPQPPNGDVYEIMPDGLPGRALSLALGVGHAARCIAMPYIDIPSWDRCTNRDTGETDLPCTTSGAYSFDIVSGAAGPADVLAENTNCGDGQGGSNGHVLCVANRDRPANKYRYDFACPTNESYEVKLVTSSGATVLTVHDTEGANYGSSKETGKVDRITFTSISSYSNCYALVDAQKSSKFMLQVRQLKHPDPSAAPVVGHRWTAIIDAGHGKDTNLITAGNGCNDTCDASKPSTNFDDPTAAIERGLNKTITAAIAGSESDRYEVIDYDTTIKPWASSFLSKIGPTTVTPIGLLQRETELDYGCDGYRGYLMRDWVQENERDPATTVVIQVHNNTACGKLPPGVPCIPLTVNKPLGSEAYFTGSGAFTSGDVGWLQASKDTMQSLKQTWLGELDISEPHAGVIRAVRGYVEKCQSLHDEGSINTTLYGPPLTAAILLEVAHYDSLGNLYYEASSKSPDEFLQSAGLALGDSITAYLCHKSGACP